LAKEAQTLGRRDFFAILVGKQQIRASVAVIDREACTAWDGGDCRVCVIVCPFPGVALDLEDFKPVVYPEQCTGCGICEQACATVNDRVAIRVGIGY
jgi:ferredoxin-type protein NapG